MTMVSVVSPFYNEEAIIEQSVRLMLGKLESLSCSWELILVNDGSVDASLEIVRGIVRGDSRVKIVSYDMNRGRGYAIRAGVKDSSGDIVVTTEIDLSWGDDIVHRLVEAMRDKPDASIIVASPHLDGGGYVNVPKFRVALSKIGNHIIRLLFDSSVSMYTGMTRAYRVGVLESLPLYENEKEFHLEVIMKSLAFGYTIYEIPCYLEWKHEKLASKVTGKVRKSSAKIRKLVRTHLVFSFLASPSRYLWGGAGLFAVCGLFFFCLAGYRFFSGGPPAFALILGLLFQVLSVLVFVFGLICKQISNVNRDVWLIQSKLEKMCEDLRKMCSAKPD